MPKISYKPVDHSPAPRGPAMIARILGMVMSAATLVAITWLLLHWSYSSTEREPWQPEIERIRRNYHPLLTPEEAEQELRRRQAEWNEKHGIVVPPSAGDELPPPPRKDPDDPFGSTSPPPENPDPPPVEGILPSEEAEKDRRVDLQLASRQLDRPKLFQIENASRHLTDWQPLRDADRMQAAGEFAAHNGRQLPVYEKLALQILRDLKPGAAEKFTGDYFWGPSQDVVEIYRGHGFAVEGRLYDLWQVKSDEPVVLSDGTSFDSWYTGAVALLDKGVARNEHPIEHRVVLFMALNLPDELAGLVGQPDGVSHEDKLAIEPVMVTLSGAYFRRWVYKRHVKPFASRATTEAFAPLLLASGLGRSASPVYEPTDDMLQQVRDSMRENPRFLETEAAYYTLLGKSNEPGDKVEAVKEIGYFDLATPETGPRYRGQGVRVDGMIGDNYEPLFLPPNVSGLRRVFVAYVVDDTVNLESPKRYLVHMLEPPAGLEPRALVLFNARYYRNVFEFEDARSTLRPLLIVKRVLPYAREDDGGNLVYALLGVAGVLGLMVVLSWFVLSDRRERRIFEQQQLELTRKRLQKRGGLKLKPLPGAGQNAENTKDEPPPDTT